MTPREFCLQLKTEMDNEYNSSYSLLDFDHNLYDKLYEVDLAEPSEHKTPLAHSVVKHCDCECHKVNLDAGKCNNCCMYEGWRN